MAREGVDDLVCANVVVKVDVLAIMNFWDVVFWDCNASFDGPADHEGVWGNFFRYFIFRNYGLAGAGDGGQFAHQGERLAQLALRGSLNAPDEGCCCSKCR